MTDESDSLTGQLNQVGGAATPSSGSTRPGYGGVIDNIVHGTGNLTGADAIRQLLDPGGGNLQAPSGPQGPPLEVDPDVLRDTIKVYNDEIGNLSEALARCEDLKYMMAPGKEFVSQQYVAQHEIAADSLRQSLRSHVDRLTDRRNTLQASLDSYLSAESTNARGLQHKGK